MPASFTSMDSESQNRAKGNPSRSNALENRSNLTEMLFVGDALYPGGNDAPVRDAGVATIAVNDISETKLVIETIIKLGR